VRIAILGPLVVTDDDGAELNVGGARLRTLLIRLALDAARTVPTDALIDAVWGDDPPASAANALQALVSRLRRALGDQALLAEPTGYRVQAGTDVAEFDELIASGRFDDALSLWRGEPLADVADADFAHAATARLAERRVAAMEESFARRGVSASMIGELEAFASAHPLRERPHALLISALAASGRQADAVTVYDGLRRRLADDLGLDPSPELAEAYAAMLRGDRASGNVRAALTTFVGREADISTITSRVRETRLLTLVGPGGAGKTRLATEVGRRLSEEFAGGVWMVELAPVRDPQDLPGAVADALRLREMRILELGPAGDLTDRIIRAIESRDLLLILDNCEHLIDASARLADEILGACPGVRVITTSREPLAITGESLHPVGPLATPSAGASAAVASGVAAVRLFHDRAAAVRPGFTINETNVDPVAEICRRLDGMPLAIELACARLRTLPVEAIAARLDDRFRLLTGGSRTAMARHQTLLAVVEWSWDLLDDQERRLAADLSVFRDGATVEMITAICGDVDVSLAGLVDKSFVRLDSDGRYQMLETIRLFGSERLAESGRADDVRSRLAAYLTGQMAVGEPAMRGADQLYWLDWITAERDNLSAALRWAIDSGDTETAHRLAGYMGWYWLLSDSHAEAVNWLRQVLALPGDVSVDARSLALAHYGMNAMITSDELIVDDPLGQAKASGSEHPVVALSALIAAMFTDDLEGADRELPNLLDHRDNWVRAIGQCVRGLSMLYRGDPAGAEADLRAALSRFREIGDRWAMATMTSALGELLALRGDAAGARETLAEATELAVGLGVTDVSTQALISLSLFLGRVGDLAAADDAMARAQAEVRKRISLQTDGILSTANAELARRHGDLELSRRRYREALTALPEVVGMARELKSIAMIGLAHTELALGQVGAAEKLAQQVYESAEMPRDRISMSMVAATYASAAIARDEPGRAACLIGIGDVLRGVPDLGTPEILETVEAARTALGPDGYREAYRQGSELSQDEASAALADGARLGERG
jgi:predicted ATPase/DNA-binding SARP family transcriptional activator